MAGRPAAVPELSTTGFTSPSPVRNIYRDSIRSVAVYYGGHIRPTLMSQPGHSGSSGNSSSDSSSDQSNNSGCSSGDARARVRTVRQSGHLGDARVRQRRRPCSQAGEPSGHEAQSIFNEIGGSLSTQVDGLSEAIASTMEEMMTLMEDHDSWDTEIQRGRGEVHMNTRFMVNCIVEVSKARASKHNTRDLQDLIDDTMDYLKDLLLKKSELCSDLSLGYLFLLNNYNFIAEVFEPSVSLDLELWSGSHWRPTPECEKYMYSYLQVSWGHVLSCIPKSNLPGPLHRWINTSSLAKFQSTFHKMYQDHKFWKVPDPRLRDELRKAITARVISGYRDYLGEHPELEKHIGRESSPEVLEEMLAELFEG